MKERKHTVDFTSSDRSVGSSMVEKRNLRIDHKKKSIKSCVHLDINII